ncbi:PTS fructose transporter subunit IIA [Tatumella morbirosei]|uniref:PTS fructose transporter subunit IIA n=1 Tax=Tatumella morbirosei TaxID=642227 RepID=A0A095VBF7_9GAMM|nr:phosphoenolpyruvate--protein phosphotransferase [Tatumella morbirosei]KGD72030.1 PTS fructose transporter subunit IIA [Tatumella morbirosei]
MAETIEFVCELNEGVHARPASQIEAVCNRYSCDIEWHNLRSGRNGNAKSALSLIGTDTLKGDNCRLIISGDDQQQAYQFLYDWIKEEFPRCDAPVSAAPVLQREPLPESLSRLNPHCFPGQPVSQGSSAGRLTLLAAFDFENPGELPAADEISREQLRLAGGLEMLVKTLKLQLLDNEGTATAVLEAHLSLAGDLLWQQRLTGHVAEGNSCAQAIVLTTDHFCRQFNQSDSGYLRERVLDIRDLGFRLLQQIYGEQRFPSARKLTSPSICLCEELTPGQFLELDKSLLKGLVLKSAGTTSHTVILARSFNIPTLAGVKVTALLPKLNSDVYLDADAGVVITDPSQAIHRYYRQESRVQESLRRQQSVWKDAPGKTADGRNLEVAANIALSAEAAGAFANGAESIGLFRTEMLYMDRSSAPGESELYNIFCHALESAAGRSIIVRTMDIGGDKPVPYLPIPAENNPFLGYRAVRIYPEFLTLFTGQLRAILRASAHGDLKIMIPMISSMEEILWVKEKLQEVKQQLREEQIPFNERISLGIMLEVPSVMFIIDQCCEEVDFFSIGSNDLTQYLLAVDRDNAKVDHLYNSFNPAFLRALDFVVQAVHRQGKWIGLCGELGGKVSALPLLAGLGLDEISMSAPAIPAVKAALARLDAKACRQLLNQVMNCRTPLEAGHLLAQFRMTQHDAPLISTQCIELNSDWQSKEEVIKGMTDNLLLAGRCRYPRKLEADLWAREAVFSTGLGFSFAIPHSKSEHIEQSTISVAKLAEPVAWGDEQAQFIIMLTLNKHEAGDQHMRIFSRLARRIMHQDFRDHLNHAESAVAIAALLEQELAV